VFIIVSTNNHIHIKRKKDVRTNIFKEPDGDPISYSSYEFLKIRNPNISVFQAQLIDKDRFGKDRKVEQYFLVNARY
jgi:hypothetical protein